MSARRVVRPSVLRRIPVDRHAVIEASAGTGKTFTLEHLIIELLLTAEVPLDQILVVTFTEKATNELRQRVRAAIEELSSGGGEPATASDIASGDFWTIDEAARARLARALHAFDGATIATIHAFCQRVLRENAFSSGRLFEEHQVDGREAFGRAMREALRRDVACGAGSLWLEAALGAGWSMDRIEELLWACIQAKAELRPVLSPAMLEAALASFPVEDARWGCGPSEIKGWGLHPQTAKAIGLRLAEMADAVEIARTSGGVATYALRVQDAKFAYLIDKLGDTSRPGTAGRVCAAAVELARATPTFSSGLAQTLLPAVRAQLVRRKRQNGEYDFDDMLGLVDEALRSAQAESLVAAMRSRWRYVLID
ncbi:MAG: UvrD-helicase domain-containing protein, partial [Myxococcota bacterium]|nr:UvrD-helicase domain-containing protein [Myxococcota bacterium]